MMLGITCTHCCKYMHKCKMHSQLYSKWNSVQCYTAAWMGEEFGGESIHVYVGLSPFTVHVKLSHY